MIATIIRLIFAFVIILVGSIPSIILWNIPFIKKWKNGKPANEATMFDYIFGVAFILLVFIVLPVISILFIASVIDPDGTILRVFFEFFPNDNL